MTLDKPKRIAYIDMSTGISGDMFVGAMIDAGFPIERLREGLEGVGLKGVRIDARRVTRRGLGGTKFEVIEEGQSVERERHDHGHEPHGRHLSEITRMIEGSGLPEPVRRNALAVFRAIGEAEARLHNTTVEEVHFHEVGAVDSIADVVGGCLALHEMGVEKAFGSEVPLCGGGTVTFSHGVVPVPAPATLELLKGIPTRTSDLKTELVTPTGAALLRVLCAGFGPRPDMVVEQVGYGAGTKDFPDRPNLLRVCIGRPL
jgi:uncharacterized protein (TIGR00299 family) protein